MERYRTIPRRIAAWFIDLLPFLPAFIVGGIYYSHAHGTALGVAWAFALSVSGAAYSIYFHTRYAATPGKAVLKLRVVTASKEEKIRLRHAILRESPWILMGMLGVFEDHFATPGVADVVLIGTSCWLFADNLVAIYHPKRRALHDIIAGTVVVNEELNQVSGASLTTGGRKMPQDNPYSGREAVMFDFACDAQDRGEYFLYVKIPGNIGPVERGDRFEDPLADKLSELGVGNVCGGGSQLGEAKTIEYCGIDVILTKREEGLSVLLDALRALGAPAGSVVEEYLPSRIDHPVHI